MFSKLSSFIAKPNSIFTKNDLTALVNTQLLDSVSFVGVQFTENINLADMSLHENNELTSINLSGSEGLSFPLLLLGNPARPVPLNWAALTKLTTLNLQSCGLTSTTLGEFLKDFAQRVTDGLGSAILTGKTLTLNGQNAPLLVSDPAVAAAKSLLISKGWTVTHN